MALGEILKQKRLERNWTREYIAERTHMMTSTIEALEVENFKKIPAPIYGRGFITNYCKVLNINPQPLIEEYMSIVDKHYVRTTVTRPDIHDSPLNPEPPIRTGNRTVMPPPKEETTSVYKSTHRLVRAQSEGLPTLRPADASVGIVAKNPWPQPPPAPAPAPMPPPSPAPMPAPVVTPAPETVPPPPMPEPDLPPPPTAPSPPTPSEVPAPSMPPPPAPPPVLPTDDLFAFQQPPVERPMRSEGRPSEASRISPSTQTTVMMVPPSVTSSRHHRLVSAVKETEDTFVQPQETSSGIFGPQHPVAKPTHPTWKLLQKIGGDIKSKITGIGSKPKIRRIKKNDATPILTRKTMMQALTFFGILMLLTLVFILFRWVFKESSSNEAVTHAEVAPAYTPTVIIPTPEPYFK